MTDPVTSPKFKLDKTDAPKILKAWANGSALAVVAFTGTFMLSSIEWGVLAGVAAQVIPAAIATLSRLFSGPVSNA